MQRPSALCALALLGWLLVCPLASAGVLAACHEGEDAMDCCMPHEGSGSQPLAKVVSAAPLGLAVAAVEAPLPAVLETVAAGDEPVRFLNGPRLHSRLSVFLV